MKAVGGGYTCERCKAKVQTWAAKCSICKETKWPTQVEEPTEAWVCALCRVTGPEKVQNRALRGKQGWERRRAQG